MAEQDSLPDGRPEAEGESCKVNLSEHRRKDCYAADQLYSLPVFTNNDLLSALL